VAATCAVLLAAAGPAAAQAPTFDGCDAAAWATRLEDSVEPWVSQLAEGGEESLPILAALLDHDNYYVRLRTHLAIQRLGSAAIRLETRLLAQLRDGESWSNQQYAAMSLAAVGGRSPEVLDTLGALCARTDVPALRATCARTLAALCDDATQRLLAHVERGGFASDPHAVDALVAVGDGAIAVLLDALAHQGRSGTMARAALPAFGWRAAARLERAGHRDLAELAFRQGAVRDVSWADEYELVIAEVPAAHSGLLELEFETGSGHGQNLALWRASEGAGGLVLERISLTTDFEDGGKIKHFVVTTDRAVLPRVIAYDLARYVAALGKMSLQPKGSVPSGQSTGNFHAVVRATVDGQRLLDARFSGYPGGRNAPERFRAEAAMHALFEATKGLKWTPREPGEQDQKLAAARAAAADDENWWVRERLRAMAESLRQKQGSRRAK